MERMLLDEQHFPPDMIRDLQKVSIILMQRGAQKIIVYGSLARGDYRPDSDIDLCVEGLPDQVYFRALAECMMAIDRPLSLVALKDTHGYFRTRILTEGKIIYA
ncbi:nucleotidyltransferase domain-containing protein [Chloroflexus sp.]|uniref:nucleotidyltransferase family protein n=1 Tax=Chloroflexus sp. TaxID=1904827 RepID=UPI002ACE813A|nr:nucleotidyltransferase domain-containing protein [Chloroflexus sp.]MCX7858652.1 nucleotidyltransferase domain-containing protein [Chloroflexus sp.]